MNQMPKYSVLYSGYDVQEEASSVKGFLQEGLKVIWFGSSSDESFLSGEFKGFIDAHLLLVYRTSLDERFIVIDGCIDGNEDKLSALSEDAPDFNLGQYLVEHCQEKNIIVKASAGTGKTTVMMDRIMYIIHMGLADLSEINMITFTNEATNQMNRRLQKVILTRYRLTGKQRYLSMLEGMSRIKVSTIDSFSLDILKRFGTPLGYSKDLSVRSFTFETKEAIRDLINEFYGGGAVKANIGMTLNDAVSVVYESYLSLTMLGLSPECIRRLDWGTAPRGRASCIQELMVFALNGLDGRLSELRRRTNSVSLSDVIRDLNGLLLSGADMSELGIKYLFIDEFQDTSFEQITFTSWLSHALSLSLFVVGDVKQSIYRFRGSEESAFECLVQSMERAGCEPPVVFELLNNYRTDEKVLNRLDSLFRGWCSKGLLSDFDRLVPCMGDLGGGIRSRSLVNKAMRTSALPIDVNDSLEDLKKRVESGDAPKDSKVAVLVRGNKSLDEISRACGQRNVPIISKHDEPLYLTQAARDLFTLLSSYVFAYEPVHMFNYLVSPYSGLTEPIDLKCLSDFNGNRDLLSEELQSMISSTDWPKYLSEFRFRPALSVIMRILDEIPVVDNYVSMLKRMGKDNEKELWVLAKRYRLDLDKILMILHRNVSGDSLSLYHIYSFLKLSIETDRTTLAPEMDIDESGPVACSMTVHKAKGLEFDTVILPYDYILGPRAKNEVLVSSDHSRIGWVYYPDGPDGESIANSNYSQLRQEEDRSAQCEETRVLYVALTRTKRNLIVYTPKMRTTYFSWSRLLAEVSL